MTRFSTRGRSNVILGVVLVGLGAMFLLGRFFNVDFGRFLWPFFIIVPGLLFFVGMVLLGKQASPLAIPGSIVTMTGLLLLYQSLTNHWESWAYAWALIFPTAVGVGLMINGGWSDNDRLVAHGARWAGIGVAIFIVLGIFFELLLNISGTGFGSVVWPLALIGFGLYLLMRRGAITITRRAPAPPTPIERPPQKKQETEFEPLDMTRARK